MRFFISTVLSTILVAAGLSAGAQERSRPVGVVELFTSQGCSSCPKADAVIAALADSDDVVAISYHIDYWNYLGWADTLGAKENTDRQYAYARSLGNNNVFTPQIVLNGVRDARASETGSILSDLAKLDAGGQGVRVPVTAELADDQMTISVGPGTGKADVVIAYFKKHTVVNIERGENVGKKVTYRNAVVKLETVGMWDGKALTIKLPSALLSRRGHDGCAIMLQARDRNGNPGRIYGAAAL
jgi:hypothetical protein